MGVTKERIRQLQLRAMDKLRQAADEDRTDLEMAMAGPARKLPTHDDSNPWETNTGGD